MFTSWHMTQISLLPVYFPPSCELDINILYTEEIGDLHQILTAGRKPDPHTFLKTSSFVKTWSQKAVIFWSKP